MNERRTASVREVKDSLKDLEIPLSSNRTVCSRTTLIPETSILLRNFDEYNLGLFPSHSHLRLRVRTEGRKPSLEFFVPDPSVGRGYW